MSVLSVLGSITKYFGLATQAVATVQQQMGPSGGNVAIQQSKAAAAVAIILAAAHAGESVPVSGVQDIASVVELVVSVANALGLFGKVAKGLTVSVPAVPPAQ